jgi:hypothetical protein
MTKEEEIKLREKLEAELDDNGIYQIGTDDDFFYGGKDVAIDFEINVLKQLNQIKIK